MTPPNSNDDDLRKSFRALRDFENTRVPSFHRILVASRCRLEKPPKSRWITMGSGVLTGAVALAILIFANLESDRPSRPLMETLPVLLPPSSEPNFLSPVSSPSEIDFPSDAFLPFSRRFSL